MRKIAVVTDSNSGITQDMSKKLGVFVLPMPFYINGDLYYEDINLTQEEFYKWLEKDADISTSQPAPGDVMKLWNDVLKNYDELIYIPMSSGLSGSCETAAALSKDYEGKVHVIDNKRVSVTQRQSVLDALEMVQKGLGTAEIIDILNRESMEARIYITVDTLKYLKKGGRVTAAGAALGSVLNIKPVLKIMGEKLDALSKARGWKAARKTMIDEMHKNLMQDFKGEKVYLSAAYTGSDDEAALWKAELSEKFPGMPIHMDRLSLSISCHIGPGALAVACSRKPKY